MITESMMNMPHIVGVPALFLWSLANSIAFQTSASERIFFPSSYFPKNVIPSGMRENVRTEENMRLARMKMISDIDEAGWRTKNKNSPKV